MRDALAKWVSDADALYHMERFEAGRPEKLEYLRLRGDDFYISLVSELFDRLREPYADPADWSRLGNAITQVGIVETGQESAYRGILAPEAAIFAAAAFYFGGYPASAYLTLNAVDPDAFSDIQRACYELLSRPSTIKSAHVEELINAVRRGDLALVQEQVKQAAEKEAAALKAGPDEWIGWRLFKEMVSRFEKANVRAVLPDGESDFWDPLVQSLLDRSPPVWDFFPSQIDAIRSGLLEKEKTFSIQMPTGSGKTALSEILLFHHLRQRPRDAAILLVPYRSLAAELRGTLVRRLGRMGLSARSMYGGTVPMGDEVHALDETRVIVATPEALSGLLSAEKSFFDRTSLVICDEGHLLDSGDRGVGLELLLARMQAREVGPPKVVFISAIVPNIDEINAWLGGTEETVVHSDYRPALADFAMLEVVGKNANANVALKLHPHLPTSTFTIGRFLTRDDFQYHNAKTRRLNTYQFNTVKTQAIATARKALPMGAVAVFAANKRGKQGAIGLAEELLAQLERPLPLPEPIQFVKDGQKLAKLEDAIEYFTLEYGDSWIGTQTLEKGAVLHHGDIPQESREVLEGLVRYGDVRLTICTNTLAEGVNLPIRTLVLYSVRRQGPDGTAEDLLARDIKNLVGRAGRAGASTKGLIICANPNQWRLVEPVAKQQPSERVSGSLLRLMERLRSALEQRNRPLTNESLERTPVLHTLIDGIDMTLIDLAAEELGEDELIRIAKELSNQTFAAQQAGPEIVNLMEQVFTLRAQRVTAVKNAGRLSWIRETGARMRMLDLVEAKLLPLRERWDNIKTPTDPELLKALLKWARELPEVAKTIKSAYQDKPPSRSDFANTVVGWLEGRSFVDLASQENINVDTILSVHSKVISHALQAAVEQGIALLKKLLEAKEHELSQAVVDFPDHLRFGVPTTAAKILAANGVRHRRAAVALGLSPELESITDRKDVFLLARDLIEDDERWSRSMGKLVLNNTKFDLAQIIYNFKDE